MGPHRQAVEAVTAGRYARRVTDVICDVTDEISGCHRRYFPVTTREISHQARTVPKMRHRSTCLLLLFAVVDGLVTPAAPAMRF